MDNRIEMSGILPERTTLNISISQEDKTFLKIYAAELGTSVASVIHDCVDNLRCERSNRLQEMNK